MYRPLPARCEWESQLSGRKMGGFLTATQKSGWACSWESAVMIVQISRKRYMALFHILLETFSMPSLQFTRALRFPQPLWWLAGNDLATGFVTVALFLSCRLSEGCCFVTGSYLSSSSCDSLSERFHKAVLSGSDGSLWSFRLAGLDRSARNTNRLI